MISIQKVPRTCSILVAGVPAGVGIDYIELYFEKHAGSGVTDTKPAGDHIFIVTFAHFEGNANFVVLLCCILDINCLCERLHHDNTYMQ